MNIGLVIVNYNDSDNVIKLVKSVEKFKSLKSIVIVDNDSYTSEINKLKSFKSKRIVLIENDKNYGYAYAMNMGAKYINELLENAIICFSNTDIKITSESTLINMAKHINDEVKCVMPKVKEDKSYKYGWKLTSPLHDLIANIPLFNRLFRGDIINYPEEYFESEQIVDVIYGCFFMVEGSTLKEIDYFDDKTFLYYEEYILARKLKAIDKLSVVDINSYVIHEHNAVIGNNVSLKEKYKIYKKSQLYYEKKYNKANFLEMFLFRLFYLVNLIPYQIKYILKK